MFARLLHFLVTLTVTLWLAFLTAAVIECHRPADLTSIQGLKRPAKPDPGPDVLERMEQAIWRREAVLEISEADINRHLAMTLGGSQKMPSALVASFDRVALSFRPGLATLWLVWKSGERQNTASINFTVKREPKNFIVEPVGGKLGRLPVYRGALAVLLPGLRTLCKELDDEIRAVFRMNQIRFEQHKLVLDPRFPKEK